MSNVIILDSTEADLKAGVAVTGGANAKAGVKIPASLMADGNTVTVLVDNPKRVGSASFTCFAYYGPKGKAQSVKAALEAGVRRIDLRHDFERGFISITPAKAAA